MKHAKAAVRFTLRALEAVGNAVISIGIVVWFVSMSITVAALAVIAAALIDGLESIKKWSESGDE
jgi:hypothetical protein